ncbi:hypothetical protein DXC07_08920 [Bacteroides uniformis]|uniref:Uncharacterized protein n=1 Tax=Bacteroides uniformis TaxID=820 RepID=A0A3E4XM74_BACUN|nr:hypothetical protein DXC07_08920 [Bacteroides uniformis]
MFPFSIFFLFRFAKLVNNGKYRMFHYAAFLFYMSFIDNSLALKKMNVEKGTSLECNWSLWRCSFLLLLPPVLTKRQ